MDHAPTWLCWDCYGKRYGNARTGHGIDFDNMATREQVWENLSAKEREFMQELNEQFGITFVQGALT